MKHLIALAVLIGSLLTPVAAHAQTAPCQFVLGFATVAAAVSQVGQCQDNQSYSANGDAIQHTTGGLLVWRKADNWTAFTDGYRTWLNGPNGIQQRLNTDRFPWEALPSAPALPTAQDCANRGAGWTWNGAYCNPASTVAPSPAPQPTQQSGPSQAFCNQARSGLAIALAYGNGALAQQMLLAIAYCQAHGL